MGKKVLTTHVGSLPRTEEVTRVLFSKEEVTLENEKMVFDDQVNDQTFDQIMKKATGEIIARQKAIGIDLPSDGEVSKISYATYIKDRLSGFSGDSPRRIPADLKEFSSYAQKIARSGGTPSYKRPQCVGKIEVKNLQPLYRDIEREKQALNHSGYDCGFMNSASPGTIALFQPSIFHSSHEDYLIALSEAMREEYETINRAGLELQIDSPDLGLGRHMLFHHRSEEDFLKIAEQHVEILNHALRNIPADKIRLHICWGNYEGPHHCDLELKKILPILLKAKPRKLLFESANPRHAHEWKLWKEISLPDDYILCPGVIDSTSNFIEHPEWVAERIENFVGIVGSERVIASTDCGFATFAGFGKVHPDIVWAKLQSLVQGASIVSNRRKSL